MQDYKKFIDSMAERGLINKKSSYIISFKKETLSINEKEQPLEIVQQYDWFLKGRKDFTIKKTAEDFSIQH